MLLKTGAVALAKGSALTGVKSISAAGLKTAGIAMIGVGGRGGLRKEGAERAERELAEQAVSKLDDVAEGRRALDIADVPDIEKVGFDEYMKFFDTHSAEETRAFIRTHKSQMDETADTLKDLFPDREVTGRLKGAANVEEKIYRDFMAGEFPPGTTFDEARAIVLDSAPTEPNAMRDVAGTRITVDSIEEERKAARIIEETYGDGIIKRKDFLKDDYRGDGYRSIHYVVDEGGVPVEIQIRTPDQTSFADWTHDYIYKGEFKNNQEATSYAKKVGDTLHNKEMGLCDPCVFPDCPPILAQAGACYGG
ncbi:MAG: hypothetical protein R6U32_06705 [Candidatus Woesearchaeota archaeon]